MQESSRSNFVRAVLYGLSAVSIWAAFIVVSRLGVRTSLTLWDVAAIRFGVAGVLLLPYLMKRGLAVDRLGWIGLAVISVGCGAPMVLLVNTGLLFAPAAHAGALFAGVMPLMVAMLAAARGQTRPIDDVCAMSALPPIATELVRRGKRRKGPRGNIKGSPRAR
jgi:drug/metabolite transporter (DMT)-like permease